MFITFEGIDGSGKTTQLQMLHAALQERGVAVIVTREPGGTGLAESIRNTLLHAPGEISPRSELLLFGAARAQHVTEIIRPALESGVWVLSDRFGDSSVAYQGGGLGLDADFIRAMNAFATANLQPDLTFYLDLPPHDAFERRQAEREDKIEARGLDFQKNVRAGYLEISKREAERVQIIDANQSPEAIHQRILSTIDAKLAQWG